MMLKMIIRVWVGMEMVLTLGVANAGTPLLLQLCISTESFGIRDDDAPDGHAMREVPYDAKD